jgi:asparagine synthase (glutamine-hydrolysing)
LVIEGNHLRVQRYYDLSPDQFEKSRLSFNDAQAQYRELFVDAIKLRMRSDVEVGSTLSGGLDSSAIVSVAAHLTNRSFQTFSAYYTYDARYDERQWIDLVSRAHNLQDHYISVQPEQALQDFYRMTFFMDYPVLGSSYLSQYYVMKLAQQHGVTVLLDGQGSDEISAGYNHAFYRYYADLLRQFRFGKLMRDFPGYLRLHQKGAPWQKILKTLVALAFKESTIYRMEGKHAFSNPFRPDFSQSALDANILDLPTGKLANFSYNLLMNTMLQTLLHYEDRNSMSFSIESRVPFLDYRLVEFVFSLPGDYKISKHIGKLIHREALRPLVPKAIIERKDKVSFFSPGEAFWLKNEFRDYTQSVFTSNSFKNRGIYDISGIDKMYQRYLHGETQSGSILWKVFALEHWFRVFIDQKPEQWINY